MFGLSALYRPWGLVIVAQLLVVPFLIEQGVESFSPSLGPQSLIPSADSSLRSSTTILSRDEIPSSLTTESSSRSNNHVNVVLPGDAFRGTNFGELSVASCNLLAPLYHSLALQNASARDEFAQQDRSLRFPLALNMAKETNADILLLQEIEGGPLFEPTLEHLLKEPLSDAIAGYDSYVWMPLLPNKPDHPVGLCVAWRSQKHELMAHEGYKRGMVCQFREKPCDDGSEKGSQSGGTFALANVHLPARPNQILGRLVYMSRTVQTLASMDVPTRESPLDGLLLVGGDWNCDPSSVTARLLTHGWISPGNVRDRNYKANVSKVMAARMGHGYRFHDVYGSGRTAQQQLRQQYAPVTVSLHGRGPGCMDHLFYTQAPPPPPSTTSRQQRSEAHSSASSGGPATVMKSLVTAVGSDNGNGNSNTRKLVMSKRKGRRDKATRLRRVSRGSTLGKSGSGSFRPHVQVESVLATIGGLDDVERLTLINQGLPNVERGYPSDHIPIGALFVPKPAFGETDESSSGTETMPNLSEDSSTTIESPSPFTNPGGTSSSVQRRREAGRESMSIRRRHNLVLRTVAEWLESSRKSPAAQEVTTIRDQPLYKNPWTKDLVGLTKKSRAPDLVCIIGNVLVIVEISVVTAAKIEAVVQQKYEKYKDLPILLQASSKLQQDGFVMAQDPLVIVMDEEGMLIPNSTRQSVETLACLLYPTDRDAARLETERCCEALQQLF